MHEEGGCEQSDVWDILFCLVFFYNKSLLLYSCFTKVVLVPSLYYLICDKLCAVNG